MLHFNIKWIYFVYLWFISNQGEYDGQDMWHIWERRVINTEFWWTNLNKNGHLEDLGIDGRMILKQILHKQDGIEWTGFIWLWIDITGRPLWTQLRIFGFKMQAFLDVTSCQLCKKVLSFHLMNQGAQKDPENGCTKLLQNDGKYLPVGVT